MTLDEIKRLIEFIRSQELAEFELEQDGFKLRVKSGGASTAPLHLMPAMPVVAAPLAAGASLASASPLTADASGIARPTPGTPGAAAAGAASIANDAAADEESGPELAIVKSPIVGTFYRAAEPGAKSFVSVGDAVKKGEVLCIIEAMKLMNEIDSEYDGEIVSIYVENGQPVQYGERLFAIRLKS
jgi:acetyl-CoA carboxylase biotin carboxyl carrier protein